MFWQNKTCMKKLLAILVLGLFLTTPSKADDISDFQIEGMSIGDSALDYFSEKKIKKHIAPTAFTSKKYIKIRFKKGFADDDFIETYDSITFYVKKDDKKYIIASINAHINYKNGIEKCKKQIDEIVEELSSLFNNVTFSGIKEQTHPSDKSGESKIYSNYFSFKSGAEGKVACVDVSVKKEAEGKIDQLKVTLGDENYSNWLRYEAYK